MILKLNNTTELPLNSDDDIQAAFTQPDLQFLGLYGEDRESLEARPAAGGKWQLVHVRYKTFFDCAETLLSTEEAAGLLARFRKGDLSWKSALAWKNVDARMARAQQVLWILLLALILVALLLRLR